MGEEIKFVMTKEQKLHHAFSKVFSLGQDYWRQSDSESPKQWDKADITLEDYQKLVDETIKEILDGN